MSTPKHHLLLATATLALTAAATTPATARPGGICTWLPSGPLLPTEWDALHARECALPLVDDTSKDYKPWSYQPACAHPKDTEEKGEKGGKYCVYTANATRGARTLTLLATPEIAAEVAGYLEDWDPRWLHPQGREYYVPIGERDGGYVVKEVEGKGLGAVARRRIKAGEVLVRETPAVMSMVGLPGGVGREERMRMWEVAVGRLRGGERGEVVGMAGGAGVGGTGEGGEGGEGIMNTNGFGVDLGGERVTVLAPAVARINHSCRPNAFTRYSTETMTLEAVAYVDIEEGEEITISYLPLNLLSEDRKAMLQRWKFTCTCPLCSSEVEEATSDLNKGRIQGILDKLRVEQGRTQDSVKVLIKELEGILKAERLESQAGGFSSILSGMYFQMLDLDKAKQYAARAVREYTHYAGYDSDKVEAAKGMVAFLDGVEYFNLD